jgi:hypothetical protein
MTPIKHRYRSPTSIWKLPVSKQPDDESDVCSKLRKSKPHVSIGQALTMAALSAAFAAAVTALIAVNCFSSSLPSIYLDQSLAVRGVISQAPYPTSPSTSWKVGMSELDQDQAETEIATSRVELERQDASAEEDALVVLEGTIEDDPPIKPQSLGMENVTLTDTTTHPLARQNQTTITTSVITTDMPTHPLARHNQATSLSTSVPTNPPTAGLSELDQDQVETEVIAWKGLKDMRSFIQRSWRGNKLCDTMQERNETHKRPTLLNITFGCQEVFTWSAGTGNFITAFYGVRLTASVFGNVNVQMSCPDAVKKQTNLILPWLMGSFPVRGGASHVVWDQSDTGIRGSTSSESGSHISKNASNTVPMPTIKEACMNTPKIGLMAPDIRYELRRMAVALVGVPHENHPAAAFADRYLWNPKDDNNPAFSDNTMQLSVPARGEPPLIPGVVLDDVVLNFRGGDLFDSRHGGYGFMKFSAFSKRIPPETKSIGIVTQPFGNSAQQRRNDKSSKIQERGRVVVMALVDFLQEKFPQARVTIHNGPTETIALAFARMVMAKQTIVGITTFGVFPAIASFGTGYIRKPIKGPNQFLMHPPIDQLVDNVILMDEPNLLMVGTSQAVFQHPTGQDLVLEWFKNDTYCTGHAPLVCFFPLGLNYTTV